MDVNKAPSGRSESAGLDVDRIVREAWLQLEEGGLSSLSTRSLAKRLGVKSPALYWHIPNKDALLSLMVEGLLLDSLTDLDPSMNWPDWLKAVGRSQRALLLSHRDGGILCSIAPPTQNMQENLFPRIMAPLLAAGMAPEQASAAAGSLAAFILGYVIYEQSTRTRPFVEAFHRPDSGFERGLEALVRGFQAVEGKGGS